MSICCQCENAIGTNIFCLISIHRWLVKINVSESEVFSDCRIYVKHQKKGYCQKDEVNESASPPLMLVELNETTSSLHS